MELTKDKPNLSSLSNLKGNIWENTSPPTRSVMMLIQLADATDWCRVECKEHEPCRGGLCQGLPVS